MKTTPLNPANAAAVATPPVPRGGSVPAAGVAQGTPDAGTRAKAKEPSAEALEKSVAALQAKIQSVAPSVQFSIDKSTGRTVIKVTDTATNEVIRQIPAEEILHLDRELDRIQGLLLNKRA